MPRYFFNLYDDMICLDEEGAELPDLAAASGRAVEIARLIACEGLKQGCLHLGHRIEVADERGEVVLELPFRDAFTITG